MPPYINAEQPLLSARVAAFAPLDFHDGRAHIDAPLAL